MVTRVTRRQRLRELEGLLQTAVFELQWMADVWNAADRLAGRPGEVPYGDLYPPDLAPTRPAAGPAMEG